MQVANEITDAFDRNGRSKHWFAGLILLTWINIYYQLFHLSVIIYPSANHDAGLGNLFVKDAPEV